jgi:vanillate/3-O-methylgallate O-demethylase
MTAQLIDGTLAARKVREDVAQGVAKLVADGSAPPGLATVLIGDDQEISEYYRSPVELGWARTVNLDHDFLARDALAAEKAAPRRVLRTLEWDGGDVTDVYASLYRDGPNYTYMEMPRDQRGFMWADRVTRDGRDIGVTTSRGYSYCYRKMLSLATIDADQAEVGGTAEIVWGNPGDPEKVIRARIAPAPYKPDNARGDLHAAE